MGMMEFMLPLVQAGMGLVSSEQAREAARQNPLTNLLNAWFPQPSRPGRPGQPARPVAPNRFDISIPQWAADLRGESANIPAGEFPEFLLRTGLEDARAQFEVDKRRSRREEAGIRGLEQNTREMAATGRDVVRQIGAGYDRALVELNKARIPIDAFGKAAGAVFASIPGLFRATTGTVMSLRNQSAEQIGGFLSKLTTDVAHKMEAAGQAVEAGVEVAKNDLTRRASELGMSGEEISILTDSFNQTVASGMLAQYGKIASDSWDFLRQVGGDAIGKLSEINLGTAGIVGDLAKGQATAMTEAARTVGLAAELKKGLQVEIATNRAQRGLMVAGAKQVWTTLERAGLSETTMLWRNFQEPVLALAPIYGQFASFIASVTGQGNQVAQMEVEREVGINSIRDAGFNAGINTWASMKQAEIEAAATRDAASQGMWGSALGGTATGTGAAVGGFLAAKGFSGMGCIDGNALIETETGPKRLWTIAIGDRVLSTAGDYSPVVAKDFGLPWPKRAHDYIQITRGAQQLILTTDHLVDGQLPQGDPVPSVPSGDLQLENGGGYFANGFSVTSMLSLLSRKE